MVMVDHHGGDGSWAIIALDSSLILKPHPLLIGHSGAVCQQSQDPPQCLVHKSWLLDFFHEKFRYLPSFIEVSWLPDVSPVNQLVDLSIQKKHVVLIGVAMG